MAIAKVHFDTADTRDARIADFRQTVGTKEGQLDVVPIQLVDRTVKAHPAKGGFPAQFVIVDLIAIIRRERPATVDAAGAETARPCRIDKRVFIELIGRVQLMDEASVRRCLVHVCAGAARNEDRHWRSRRVGPARRTIGVEARRFAGLARISTRETEEPLQRVLIVIDARTTGERQLVSHIKGHFTERRLIAVNALLLGQPDVAGRAGDGDGISDVIDDVILFDSVRLTLPEQTRDHAQALIRWRRNAEFLEILFVLVLADNILVRADISAVIVIEERAVARDRVVEEGVVRIVGFNLVATAEEAVGVGQVPIAELALNRQARIPPFIGRSFGVVLDRFIFAATFLRIAAVGLLDLAHQRRGDRPAVIKVDTKGDAAAIGFGIVIVLFDKRRIVGNNARGRESAGARDIVDIATVAAVPADCTDRDVLADRGVDEAFHRATNIAMRHAVQFRAQLSVKALGVRLVGNELDRAGHGAGTVERALRACERFHARQIVNMDVERALNGRDRLFIQIHANGRLRGGVVGVLARGDRAEVNLAEAWPRRLDRDRRQELHIIGKFLNLKLVKLFRANGLNGERHALQ